MNNEETIIMPNGKASTNNAAQNVDEAKNNNKPRKGNAAKTAAGVGLGIMAGGLGGAAAATAINHEPTNDEPNHDTAAQPEVEATQDDQDSNQRPDNVPVTVDDNNGDDFSGNNGADPVVAPISDDQLTVDDGADTNEVQVLGVYDAQGEDGQPMQFAALTDGDSIAVVVDVDYDGIAENVWVDYNQNGQIEENEVFDISNDQIYMSNFTQAEDQSQQMHYTGYDNTPDFCNNADVHDV